MGCDYTIPDARFSRRKFQSTHPSGVRPDLPRRPSCRVISIHAPQWGATHAKTVEVTTDVISIHAPQWGATPSCNCSARYCYFNPRTPVGCDRHHKIKQTHTINFNPRTPVGCDTFTSAKTASVVVFQSTHPSGVRRVANTIFNSIRTISIHAPQWGACVLASWRPLCERCFSAV